MVREEVRVISGYEEIYDKLVLMKNGIEEEVRKQIEEKSRKIDNMIAEITEIVEVEITENSTEEVQSF